MGLPDHDSLPPAFHEALLLPSAENPADRVKRSAGHFGDILARDRKVDLNSGFHLPACLPGQTEQGMCNPLLDLFGRHLDDARVRVLEPATDCLERVDGERRMPLDQARPGR